MPRNITASKITMVANTRRALRHSTGRKAITLSLIASMPVRAAQPELKARIISTGPMAMAVPWEWLAAASESNDCCCSAASAGRDPWSNWISPVPTSSRIEPRNR